MRETRDSRTWACETFADAKLGDARRTSRLVRMAASVAERPAGTVTRVFEAPAEREGAYRLLENKRVCPRELVRTVAVSTAKKCQSGRWVYVAIDQTTLSFIDRKNCRGLGRVADGAYGNCRGLEVINGLAIDDTGATVGMSAMRWMARPDQSTAGRPPAERESTMWREVMADTAEHFGEHAPDTVLWFQLDAGGDHAQNYFKAIELGHHITIRCAHNRLLMADSKYERLFEALSRQPVIGQRTLVRRRGERQKSRRVHLKIRACRITVRFPKSPTNYTGVPVDLWAVQVRQVGYVAKGAKRICWNLLTTYQVDELEDALEVVDGYAMRWRIEDFYRTWKDGHCRLEDSQLRSRGAILRWAILLAAVAARIERIKHRSREEPEAPASSEFTRDEIDAALTLSKSTRWKHGDDPELGDFVELVAGLGGYTGKSSGGPPGSVTIARGLDWITPAAVFLSRTRGSG